MLDHSVQDCGEFTEISVKLDLEIAFVVISIIILVSVEVYIVSVLTRNYVWVRLNILLTV